jgi:adenylate cyclase
MLVQKDESLAHERIKDAFQRFSKTISAYGGTAREIRGDALVAEFSRASDAVCAALAFQSANTDHNTGIGDEIRPEIRVGISLAEVVVADGTMTGAGVVLAQRLEQLANAGGVVVQGSVSETVPARLPFEFESLGEQVLKGFDQPVRAFVARLRPGELLPAPESNAAPIIPPDLPADTTKPPTLEVPDKPSIAVLPFTNISGDPEQQYFADGITENIITGLTRFRDLFVIAVESSFAARDRATDVQQIARQLGVAHVVEGSVRKAANRVRVTAQLIDATSGQRVWAEHYDRDLDDIFVVQDEITNIIVATLAGRIEEADRHRAQHKAAKDMAAYDYWLRGRQCLNRYTKEGELEARRHFERALELDPGYAAAYAGLAVSYLHEYESSWSEAPREALDYCYQLSQKAVALDAADSTARCALASAYFYRNQHELAKIQIEKALALNPNDYDNLCAKGWLLAFSGELVEGIACSKEAMRLNPFAPEYCLFAIGVAEYVARRYEAAIGAFGKMASLGLLKPAFLAACYAQLGRDEQARAAAAEVLESAKTELAIPLGQDAKRWRAYWAKAFPFQNPDDLEHLVNGLRKAGLPA